MKFTSKDEAYRFLLEKNSKNEAVTEEEKEAVLEFFSLEEYEDLSFTKINISSCFSHHS